MLSKYSMKCKIIDCNNKSRSNDLCNKHYLRWRRYGDPLLIKRVRSVNGLTICKMFGCNKKHSSKGYCIKHYIKYVNNSPLKYNRRMRVNLFSVLGEKKCVCKGINCWHDGKCMIIDMDILQFDHINNDGNLDRKKFKNSTFMFKYYVDHPEEAKQKLQVLCANCNRKKIYNNDLPI